MHNRNTALVCLLALLFTAITALTCAPLAFAADNVAEDITSVSNVSTEGFYSPAVVLDGNYRDYTNAYNGAVITAKNANGIGYVYFIFETAAPEYTVTDTETGTSRRFGNCGMIHELLDLKSAFGYLPTSIRIDLDFHIAVSEIYLLSDGFLPDWVQRWESPLTECDMLLLVSHSDDDQLFFAGLLPLYAGENGAKVQVAYFTNHNDVANRRHELLDGLWHTGVRNYPIISSFLDLYSESLAGALDAYKSYGGYTEDDFIDFVYDLIQDTKPRVVVTHDISGEYGHGTHMLCTSATVDAINKCSAPNAYGDIDGKWHVAKLYLHLYGENRLTLDIDSPLSAFGGKSAFKVSQEAFGYHLSQHWTWFYGWLYGKNGAEITLSTEIMTHSPREYGLYFSAVGMDITHTDMLENIETLAERAERLEAESKADETSAPTTEPPSTEATDAPVTELQTDIATEPAPDTTVTADVQTTTVPVRTPSKTDNEINKTAVVAIALAAVLCSVVLLVINAKSSRYSRYSRKPHSRRR